MTKTKTLSTGQTARLLEIKIHRIQYHFSNGDLPEVSKTGTNRVYSESDVRGLAEFFEIPIDEDAFSNAFGQRGQNV